jgi:hypothetical protein
MVNFAGTPQDDEYINKLNSMLSGNFRNGIDFSLIKNDLIDRVVEERYDESIENYLDNTKSSY